LDQVRGRPRFEEILGLIARDAIELLTGPQRERLRECAAQDCRGIYVDTSPGRTRRWCSAARCGNRARVAAHRARRTDATISTATVEDRSVRG
jgi:predicted RNA-binding Zn ribbon-like protein